MAWAPDAPPRGRRVGGGRVSQRAVPSERPALRSLTLGPSPQVEREGPEINVFRSRQGRSDTFPLSTCGEGARGGGLGGQDAPRPWAPPGRSPPPKHVRVPAAGCATRHPAFPVNDLPPVQGP